MKKLLIATMGVIALGLGLVGLSSILKRFEKRAQTLPVDQALADQYAAVCNSWVKKPLPDF